MVLLDAAEIASIRGSSTTRQVAKAQAVFDKFCGSNSALLRIAAEDRAAIKGQLNMSNLANAHAVLAIS